MDDQLAKATPAGLFSSRRNSVDAIALAADGVDKPEPASFGDMLAEVRESARHFDPERRLTHNQACVLKASNALYRSGTTLGGAGNWSGSGGAFSEPGTTRHYGAAK